jgi:uncharacterized membrane protein YidH (DUF202 family)
MKKILILFILFFLFVLSVKAQQGCCSHHGGISHCDNSIGYYICQDGTRSPSCTCEHIFPEKPNQEIPITKKPKTECDEFDCMEICSKEMDDVYSCTIEKEKIEDDKLMLEIEMQGLEEEIKARENDIKQVDKQNSNQLIIIIILTIIITLFLGIANQFDFADIIKEKTKGEWYSSILYYSYLIISFPFIFIFAVVLALWIPIVIVLIAYLLEIIN